MEHGCLFPKSKFSKPHAMKIGYPSAWKMDVCSPCLVCNLLP